MRKVLLLSAVLAVVVLGAVAVDAATLNIMPGTTHTVSGETWTKGVISSTEVPLGSLDFWLQEPDNVGYNPASPGSDDLFPLVIFLHGAGKNNASSTEHLSLAAPKFWVDDTTQAKGNNGGAFIMAPKITNNEKWVDTSFDGSGSYLADSVSISDELTLAMVAAAGLLANADGSVDGDFITKIDPNRVYIVGQSEGGRGTWDSMARQTELSGILSSEGDGWAAYQFAAAMPAVGTAPSDRDALLASVPTWTSHHTGVVTHGLPDELGDDTVAKQGTQTGIDSIEAILGSVFFQTTDVTKTGDSSGTDPIDESLAALLAEDYLFSPYTGAVPTAFLAQTDPEHGWASQTWHIASPHVADWLFSHQIPEPATGLLLLAGAGAMVSRFRRRARRN